MILSAHQPVYLPWLGLFHKVALADTFVWFDDVQYLPKDWNNRNKIKTPQGATWLTVPVESHGHRDKPIMEIRINNREPWRRKHWRSISLNYKAAPYFDTYAPFLEDVYARDWEYLSELNEYLFRWFLSVLGIEVKLLRASELHFAGKKSDLVLDMCRRLNAELYIFGALGRDYAETDKFSATGIQVMFQDYSHPVYQQLNGPFISHLCILDLLFNCGSQSLSILMSGNMSRAELRGSLDTNRVAGPKTTPVEGTA
jgi:hypothetical protein